MTTHKVGIIMNGVTGRMGTNQHLLRSIKAIIDQGGIKLSDSEVIMPDPILVGRSESKLAALAARAGVKRYTTNLDEALADLLMSDELRSSLYSFDLVNKRAKRPAGAPDKSLARKVTKVGVVGAGLMASQLALLFARKLEVPVVMTDLDQERLDKGVYALTPSGAEALLRWPQTVVFAADSGEAPSEGA